MPVDPHRSLELAAPRQEALCRAIESLTEAQWQAPSNCAGWAVADLVAHVTRNGESVLLATQRALSGDSTPAFGPTMRSREEALRASGAQACAALQRTEFAELRTLIGGLEPDQLGLTFPHPMGPRPVAWYCTARLSEVTFHGWDLGRSLGHDEPLEGEAAAYLLDYLLDSNQPVANDRRAERTADAFNVVSGTRSWVVTVGPTGPRVAVSGAEGAARRIAAEPGWLALALYGRTRIDRPEFSVSGPADTADAFAAVFGQPG